MTEGGHWEEEGVTGKLVMKGEDVPDIEPGKEQQGGERLLHRGGGGEDPNVPSQVQGVGVQGLSSGRILSVGSKRQHSLMFNKKLKYYNERTKVQEMVKKYEECGAESGDHRPAIFRFGQPRSTEMVSDSPSKRRRLNTQIEQRLRLQFPGE